MDCRKCREQLVDLLYGDLSDRKRKEVEAHLEQCPDCSREFEDMKATRMAFADLSDPEPGKHLEARIKATAMEELERTVQVKRWKIIFHPAFATAALAVIAVGVLLLETQELKVSAEKTPRPAERKEYRFLDQQATELMEDKGRGGAETAADKAVAEGKERKDLSVHVTLKPQAPLPEVPEAEKAELRSIGSLDNEAAEATGGTCPVCDRERALEHDEYELPPEEIQAAKDSKPSSEAASLDSKTPEKSALMAKHVVQYSSEGRLDYAREAMKRGEWARAGKIYSQTIAELGTYDPRKMEAEYNLARCYKELGKYAEARKMLEKYIRDYPESGNIADVMFMIAEVYELEGMPKKAKATYSQIKEKFPPRAEEADAKLKAIKQD